MIVVEDIHQTIIYDSVYHGDITHFSACSDMKAMRRLKMENHLVGDTT
jgi:hypothetical protein